MYEYLDYSSPLEYFEDVVVKYTAEISANAYAFKMLADFYFDKNTDRYSKLYDFMAYFGIPMSLESAVLKNINKPKK